MRKVAALSFASGLPMAMTISTFTLCLPFLFEPGVPLSATHDPSGSGARHPTFGMTDRDGQPSQALVDPIGVLLQVSVVSAWNHPSGDDDGDADNGRILLGGLADNTLGDVTVTLQRQGDAALTPGVFSVNGSGIWMAEFPTFDSGDPFGNLEAGRYDITVAQTGAQDVTTYATVPLTTAAK
jgi:hypothetical protein